MAPIEVINQKNNKEAHTHIVDQLSMLEIFFWLHKTDVLPKFLHRCTEHSRQDIEDKELE